MWHTLLLNRQLITSMPAINVCKGKKRMATYGNRQHIKTRTEIPSYVVPTSHRSVHACMRVYKPNLALNPEGQHAISVRRRGASSHHGVQHTLLCTTSLVMF